MTATTGSKTRTTRKIAGSLGILGAAAAVAGLGTFGTFTDSTTPVDATVASGTLAIELNAANSTASLPLSATGFVPGDKVSRSYDLVNTGDVALSGMTMISTATTSSLLDTDKKLGLQLNLQSCPTAWAETKTGTGATYACASPTTLFTGPAAAATQLDPLSSVAPRGTDHLLITLSLPTDAGNTFQGLSSTLRITFNGTQASGTAR